MTQNTETDYEAIEQQIIELFEQLSPKRKFELLEQLDTVLVDEQYAKAVNRTPTLGRLIADD